MRFSARLNLFIRCSFKFGGDKIPLWCEFEEDLNFHNFFWIAETWENYLIVFTYGFWAQLHVGCNCSPKFTYWNYFLKDPRNLVSLTLFLTFVVWEMFDSKTRMEKHSIDESFCVNDEKSEKSPYNVCNTRLKLQKSSDLQISKIILQKKFSTTTTRFFKLSTITNAGKKCVLIPVYQQHSLLKICEKWTILTFCIKVCSATVQPNTVPSLQLHEDWKSLLLGSKLDLIRN